MVGPVVGIVPVSEGATSAPLIVDPRAAPQHLGIFVLVVPVGAPFPDIAGHIGYPVGAITASMTFERSLTTA